MSHSDNWAYGYELDLAPIASWKCSSRLRTCTGPATPFRVATGMKQDHQPLNGWLYSMWMVEWLWKASMSCCQNTSSSPHDGSGTPTKTGSGSIPAQLRTGLDAEEYRAFMDGIASWLPFKVDEATHQRSRKVVLQSLAVSSTGTMTASCWMRFRSFPTRQRTRRSSRRTRPSPIWTTWNAGSLSGSVARVWPQQPTAKVRFGTGRWWHRSDDGQRAGA